MLLTPQIQPTKTIDFDPNIGLAVAKRSYLRRKGEDWESWNDVALRVATGNALLEPREDKQQEAFDELYNAMTSGVVIMSGRHLQHGDSEQPKQNLELYSNCATAATSFILFYLLMNGAGVGRSYDDDMMLVNWDNAPNIRCVLDDSHPDFDYSAHESVRDAKHKYGTGKDVMWFSIPDSREGWAKALEIWEIAAFEKIHRDKLLILDFTPIRAKGMPIKGMQNRPASGPVPLMHSFWKAASLKGAGLAPWLQAMYLDHYFAECVLVGGARRSARMSTKIWSDPSIFEFIKVKRPIEYEGLSIKEIKEYKEKNGAPFGFLWSSNNSVMVDSSFWAYIGDRNNDSAIAVHARKVYEEISFCSYVDGTGEPGIINQDMLTQKDEGWTELYKGDYVGSKKYQVEEDTQILLSKLARKAKRKGLYMITNPCLVGDVIIETNRGNIPIKDVRKGDKIKSKNLHTGAIEIDDVLCAGKTKISANVIRITLDDGKQITLTPDHKIYTKNRGWVEAGQLTEDDDIEIG